VACAPAARPAADGPLAARVAALDARLATIEKLLRPMFDMPQPPDPEAVYAVPVEGSPAIGPRAAPVTLIEAFDFSCGDCVAARGVVDSLRQRYRDRLRVVYKFFVVHPAVGTLPALAACAADQQGRFEAMAELIWTKGSATGDLGLGNLQKLAEEAGLDRARFATDLGGQNCRRRLDSDRDDLMKLGVGETPSFFVNGRPLAPDAPPSTLGPLIDAELARAEAAIQGGVPADDYYRVAVLEKGLQSSRPVAPAVPPASAAPGVPAAIGKPGCGASHSGFEPAPPCTNSKGAGSIR
jgi:protein-disulfide isomerase